MGREKTIGLIVVVLIALYILSGSGASLLSGITATSGLQQASTTTINPATTTINPVYNPQMILTQNYLGNVYLNGSDFPPNTSVIIKKIFLIPGTFVPAGQAVQFQCVTQTITTSFKGTFGFYVGSGVNPSIYTFQTQPSPPPNGSTAYQFEADYIINPIGIKNIVGIQNGSQLYVGPIISSQGNC